MAEQPETHDKRTETHACDCISRQAAIEALDDNITLTGWGNSVAVRDYILRAKKRLQAIPAAQPERKTGKWIPTGKDTIFGADVRCSVCGESFATTELAEEIYCRHCGAYMGGDTDETD